MPKKTGGGGASKRGSHHLADNGGCEVRWDYAFNKRVGPKKGSWYADFGTMIHTVLAYHYVQFIERKPQWFLDHPNEMAAIEEDSLGKPAWLRTALEFREWYRNHEAGDPLVPLYIEETFEATVREVDPTGVDEPSIEFEYSMECDGYSTNDVTGEVDYDSRCQNLDMEGQHIKHVIKRMLRLPSLDEETVTCRPDLIHLRNGSNALTDHKTKGGARDGSGRLPVLDESRPDFTYVWQAMYNLHVVRTKIDVEYFEFNRVKRDRPFDVARDPWIPPADLYATIPAAVREMVRQERRLAVKAARGEKMIAKPWLCKADWECGYTRLCYADSPEERELIQMMEYQRFM